MRILSSVVYPATCFLPVSISYDHHRCAVGTQFVRHYNSVRRQVFWNQCALKLRESLAHLVGLIMQRAGGDASAALRVSFV